MFHFVSNEALKFTCFTFYIAILRFLMVFDLTERHQYVCFSQSINTPSVTKKASGVIISESLYIITSAFSNTDLNHLNIRI